jgi:hypothetical protein
VVVAIGGTAIRRDAQGLRVLRDAMVTLPANQELRLTIRRGTQQTDAVMRFAK